MKKNTLFLLACMLCMGFLLPGIASTQTDSCVKCHTNADILKSLHKPAMKAGEEGEG
jgi:hypothetical protein